jgi:dCMP deaminase|tara:strand:- start:421 stop:849 length:429 start_codon:yes stop_codon:yes gene_type:complete
MELANVVGQNSYSKRFKCGAIIVKDDNILAFGYNGTPRGWDNCCEDDSYKTKREVLHAESNAIAKVARTTASAEGSTLYVSLSPCYDCAKLIHQAGVVRVVYDEPYRICDGIDFLEECGVQVDKYERVREDTLEEDVGTQGC